MKNQTITGLVTSNNLSDQFAKVNNKIELSIDSSSIVFDDNSKELNAISEVTAEEFKKFYRMENWKNMISGGGNITWENYKLSTTRRLIVIPTNAANGYISINLTDLYVPGWYIAYVDLTDAQLNQHNLTLTEKDFTVEGYDKYKPANTPNRFVLGYNNADDNKFIFSNGLPVTLMQYKKPITHVQTFSSTVNVSTTTKTIKLFPEIVIQAGKAVKLDIRVPTRHSGNDWGGLYINLNVKVNDTWYNLGNCGYDGNAMYYGAQSIATYTETKLLDFIKNLSLPKNSSYKVQFELTGKSFTGTTIINGSHSINSTANGLGGRGALQAWGSNQNYTTLIISEVDSNI